MLWKLGCGTILLGAVLGLGSVFLFGKAASEATDSRQVATMQLAPGQADQPRQASAEPGSKARLRIVAQVELPEADVPSRAGIYQMDADVNYKVMDSDGEFIHHGAGKLGGSTIVPDQDSPHFDGFDREVEIAHDSQTFTVPDDGVVGILVTIPDADQDGNPVLRASVEMFDNVSTEVAGWAAGGIASMLLGPLVGGVGLILFVIGVIVALARKNETRA